MMILCGFGLIGTSIIYTIVPWWFCDDPLKTWSNCRRSPLGAKLVFTISDGQVILTTNRKGQNNEHRMHQGGTRGARSVPFWSVYVVDKEGKPGSQRATPKNGWASSG